MTEAQCLAAIAAGDDAQALLLAAMPAARRRFKAVDRAIISLLADVRAHFPDATYYTASGGFNLLLGRSHGESVNAPAQQQLVALNGRASIGDGDF